MTTQENIALALMTETDHAELVELVSFGLSEVEALAVFKKRRQASQEWDEKGVSLSELRRPQNIRTTRTN